MKLIVNVGYYSMEHSVTEMQWSEYKTNIEQINLKPFLKLLYNINII